MASGIGLLLAGSANAAPSSAVSAYHCDDTYDSADPEAWSSDSAFVATEGTYATCIVDTRNKTLVRREKEIFSTWLPNRHRFVAIRHPFSRKHRLLVVVDAETGRDLAVRREKGKHYTTSLDHSSDGSLLLRASSTGNVEIWDPATLQPVAGYTIPDETCGANVSARWQPGSHRLVTMHACRDGQGRNYSRLRVVDPRAGKVLHTLDQPQREYELREPTWSPDGKQIAVRLSEHVVEILTERLESMMEIDYRDGDLHYMQILWNPTGNLLAVRDGDGARIFDVEAGEKIASIDKKLVYAVDFDWLDAENVIMHAANQDTLFAYNIHDRTKRVLAKLVSCKHEIPKTLCMSAQISPDKKHVVITRSNLKTAPLLQVVSVADTKVVFEDDSDDIQPVDIHWSPDGRSLSYKGYRHFTIAPLP